MNPELQAQIEWRIRENERAIEEAKREVERIDWTLRESKRRSERAIRELRRAGIVVTN